MPKQVKEDDMSNDSDGEIKVSFGYQCHADGATSFIAPNKCRTHSGTKIPRASSFSCLSGAAISANATLANTNMCNGLIGAEILPTLDSPNSFRRVPSSPRLDILSSSFQGGMSYLSCGLSSAGNTPDNDSFLKSMSPPSASEGFLNSMEVQVAGGAAGEDRVQAVCSEENGWLFCAVYDGFNGRDAADYLAGTLYDTILSYLNLLDWESDEELGLATEYDGFLSDGQFRNACSKSDKGSLVGMEVSETSESFSYRVLDCLQRALIQAECDFLRMVEQEMEDRLDLVSIGSCVLLVLLHGRNLYTLNLGDSRAVLATYDEGCETNVGGRIRAFQLTESHTVDNEIERNLLLKDHPDDPAVIIGGKVKGRLKVTRAFGAGYLKKNKLNDALIGILRIQNLISPPYVSTQPSLNVHRVAKSDQFVIVGSDGLFEFFSNEEAVALVHAYIAGNPLGDPAKFLLEKVVKKAAKKAGFSMEELMGVPDGARRKYHDDVTVIVIILGTNQRTSKASTWMVEKYVPCCLLVAFRCRNRTCGLQLKSTCMFLGSSSL
uniref:PPM-type phosphatase domain-containing protein n=2 Tax=Kalanchoe fedtschenkoi TaxID=63787 RepID=A0A7N0TKR9_KALFE